MTRWLATVRARVTLFATLCVGGVLVITAVVIVAMQWRQMLQSVDASLDLRTDQVIATLDASGDIGASVANNNAEDRFVILLDAQGNGVAGSANVDGFTITVPDDLDGRWTSDQIPIEDDTFRLLARPVEGHGEVAAVVIGENIDDLRDALTALAYSFVAAIPIVVAALGAIVWWLTGRTLRPVDEIGSQVEAITLSDLSRRVTQPAADDEIGRLATTMNAMLDRLESAHERQARFVADASHELRTPLTRLRSTLEVDASVGAPPDADLLLAETIGMQALVNDLLFMARHDGSPATLQTEAVDLDVIVDDEVERCRTETTTQIDIGDVSAGIIMGDGRQIERLVRNLLSNALAHAENQVEVAVTETDDAVVLTVDDDGPGIAPEDREIVLDRFTRLDQARTPGLAGAGLGLAIVRGIVDAHEADLTIGTAPLGGARVTVEFPVGAQASSIG